MLSFRWGNWEQRVRGKGGGEGVREYFEQCQQRPEEGTTPPAYRWSSKHLWASGWGCLELKVGSLQVQCTLCNTESPLSTRSFRRAAECGVESCHSNFCHYSHDDAIQLRADISLLDAPPTEISNYAKIMPPCLKSQTTTTTELPQLPLPLSVE